MKINWCAFTGTILVLSGAVSLGIAYGFPTGWGVACLYFGQRFWEGSDK